MGVAHVARKTSSVLQRNGRGKSLAENPPTTAESPAIWNLAKFFCAVLEDRLALNRDSLGTIDRLESSLQCCNRFVSRDEFLSEE